MKLALLILLLALVPQEPDLDPGIAKWGGSIGQLEQRDQSETQFENGVLYYGSSSIRNWKTISSDMAPWPTMQRGYGGAKLPDIIHYAPRIIGPHLGASNPRRCQAIVLFVANDIAGKKTDASPEQVADRFEKLHRWIRKQDATMPVFWIEVTPTLSRWRVWPQIDESTKLICKIIDGDANTHLISTAGAFLGLDGRPRRELFIKDQLHMNADGYKQWAILIKSQLHSILGATQPETGPSKEPRPKTLGSFSK